MKNRTNNMNRTLILCVAALCIGTASAHADEWTRVSDASVLSAGDRIVLACPAKGKAAGSLDTSKKMLTAVAATFSDDENIMTSAGDALVLTLGGEEDAWTLADASGRLLGASGTKDIGWDNYVHTWTIDVEDGLVTLQSTSVTYGRMLYNVNSPRFTTYTSKTGTTMLLPALYYKRYKEYGFGYEGYPEKTTQCVDIAYPEGTLVTLSAGQPVREGYTFTGWLYDGKIYQPSDVFVMPDAEVALVAQWQANTPTGVQDTHVQQTATKVLKNNTLYIIVDGKTYDVTGNKTK